jgi:hypothetical protein
MTPFDSRYLGWTETTLSFLDGPRRSLVIDLGSLLDRGDVITGVSRIAATDSVLVDIRRGFASTQAIVDTRAKTSTPLQR